MPLLEELIEEMSLRWNADKDKSAFVSMMGKDIDTETEKRINDILRDKDQFPEYVAFAEGGMNRNRDANIDARNGLINTITVLDVNQRNLIRYNAELKEKAEAEQKKKAEAEQKKGAEAGQKEAVKAPEIPLFLAVFMKSETEEADLKKGQEVLAPVQANIEENEKLRNVILEGSAAEKKALFYRIAVDAASFDPFKASEASDEELAKMSAKVAHAAMIGNCGNEILEYFNRQGLALTDQEQKNFRQITQKLKENTGILLERLEKISDPFYQVVNYSRIGASRQKMATALENAEMPELADRIREKENEIDSSYVDAARKLLNVGANTPVHFGVMNGNERIPREISNAEAQKKLEEGGIITAYTGEGREIKLVPVKDVNRNGKLTKMQQVPKPGRFVRGLDTVLRTIGIKSGMSACRAWEAAQEDNQQAEAVARAEVNSEKTAFSEIGTAFIERNRIFSENAMRAQQLIRDKKAAEAQKNLLDRNVIQTSKEGVYVKVRSQMRPKNPDKDNKIVKKPENAPQNKENKADQTSDRPFTPMETSLYKTAEKLTAAAEAGKAFETSLGELLSADKDRVREQKEKARDVEKFGGRPEKNKAAVFGSYLKNMNEVIKKMDLQNLTVRDSALIRHCDDILNVFRRHPDMIKPSGITNDEVTRMQAVAAYEKIWRDSRSAEASLLRDGLGEFKLTPAQREAAIEKVAAYKVVSKTEIDEKQNYINNHQDDPEALKRPMSRLMKDLGKAVSPAEASAKLHDMVQGQKNALGTLAAMSSADLMAEITKKNDEPSVFGTIKGAVNHDVFLRQVRRETFNKDMTTVKRNAELDAKIRSQKVQTDKEKQIPEKKAPELENLYNRTLTM